MYCCPLILDITITTTVTSDTSIRWKLCYNRHLEWVPAFHCYFYLIFSKIDIYFTGLSLRCQVVG